jgi:hypothetical protein
MKINLQVTVIIGVLFLSACASASSTADSTVAKDEAGLYLLSTRTGIEDIDVVLAAVESGDPQALANLFTYTRTNCTNVEGLGGPPKCLADEAEGTEVDVLPFLGSEGSFLRRQDAGNWAGLYVSRLYAVCQVAGDVYSDLNYPAGEYVVILLAEENVPGTVLQVTDGKVVRIDSVFDTSLESLAERITQSGCEPVLAP